MREKMNEKPAFDMNALPRTRVQQPEKLVIAPEVARFAPIVQGKLIVLLLDAFEAEENGVIAEEQLDEIRRLHQKRSVNEEPSQFYLRFFNEDQTTEDIELYKFNIAYRKAEIEGVPFPEAYEREHIKVFKDNGVAYQYVDQGFFGWAGVAHGKAMAIDGLHAGTVFDVVTSETISVKTGDTT